MLTHSRVGATHELSLCRQSTPESAMHPAMERVNNYMTSQWGGGDNIRTFIAAFLSTG